MAKKQSDFRYNTGDTRVPWAAVGENYHAGDVAGFVRFLMQGGGDDYEQAFRRVEDSLTALQALSHPPGKLSLGEQVAAAEAAADRYLGAGGSVFVTNATAGFEIAYKYANLRPGDEVIVPAVTFIATMAYPLAIGAKVVFADVDPVTVNIDVKDVERKLTPKTRMVVPVHIGGYPADMQPLMALCRARGILVLEDAAHAFGAQYKGQKAGTIGDFGAYSFHEVKNITSFGEGGIVTTNVPGFKDDLKRARFFGLDFSSPIDNWLYNVTAIRGRYGPFVAGNYSTTEIQALGLKLQIARNDAIIASRRRAAEYLNSRFAQDDAIIPQSLGNADVVPSFHLYLLQIDPQKAGGDIRQLKKRLTEKGVTNIPHFGPLYRFQVVRDMGYNVDEIAQGCPVCEEVFYRRFTHLPIYGLTGGQLEYMADAVLESLKEMRGGR